MNTVRHYLNKLPPGYRERALNNLFPDRAERVVSDIPEAIMDGFIWTETPEGFEFWEKVYQHHKALPEIPTSPLPEIPPATLGEGLPTPVDIAGHELPLHFRADTAARILAASAGHTEHGEDWLAARAVRLTDELIRQLTT